MATKARELRFLRRRYQGVLWQHPLVRAGLPVVDVFDKVARSRKGLAHIPPYSTRVRSASMVGEFGGQRFKANGERLTRELIKHADLKPDDRVLEIGCGAGRIATALASYLEPGGYVGFDIDEPSIRACQKSSVLDGFTFFVADVSNDVYRPDGVTKASEYRFPLEDDTFDLVFLASVFTHMLEDDCAHYAREIMRVLKPGSTAAVSTYLQTVPVEGQTHSFDSRAGSAYVEYPEIPTKLVSYELATFEQWFAGAEVQSLLGGWRRNGSQQIEEFQDWVFMKTPDKS